MKCFAPDDLLPTERTAEEENRRSNKRINLIKAEGFDVFEIWTCEIGMLLEQDKEMKEFFEKQFDLGPIKIRNALFGGRTGPLKLYARSNAQNGKVIKDKGEILIR